GGGGARIKVGRSKRFLTGGHDANSVFAPNTDDAANTVDADSNAGVASCHRFFAATKQRAPADRSGFNAEGTRTGESRCPKRKGVGSNGPGNLASAQAELQRTKE